MFTRTVVLTGFALLAAGLLTAASTQAASPLRNVNHLTFNAAVALPGVVLTPGAYTFEAGPNNTSRSVVRVMSRDGRRVLYTGLTIPVRRAGANKVEVVFGETQAGQPIPIKMWYPMGSSTGHAFIY